MLRWHHAKREAKSKRSSRIEAGDPEMEGDYFGYEGPCPPWNDEIPHHYRFKLFACDIERCPVDVAFTGSDVLKAIEGHVIAETELTGLYSLNPDVV